MRLWFARLLIAMVIAWNLQAALVFFAAPGVYAPGFELNGAAGEAALRGIAVLFAMWNIPYLAAAWHPRRHLTSLKEALAMQSLGLLGESAILFSLPAGHALLQGSILRFVLFDAGGLLALVIAWRLAAAESKDK